ncbi:sugar porter family MFS transporter [Aspergillus clavatus NRRL 1]|uniref:Probable quinate permease n=1 Tax=Aspergillus clavatus (strain ATCC 1007 / CBS 513.65 / DSM 816 / NCTC 3887 / NRRL 1 / QM 1276 / 107) TaxID=344612 RepID=A1CRV5_ASPCL|nr:sugar transporter [Aspergillus clavatus NRRL 1]EAW08376.1 sugar transporter [Aspergillus clavatus NRRL 1]
MGGAVDSSAAMDAAAQARRAALRGSSGMAGLVQNRKVFGIAMFACLGGLLYGYNQGVFSGVLTMYSFETHVWSPQPSLFQEDFLLILSQQMGDAVTNQTKKGWLTAILELGAWFGALYSGILCERISRKYTILLNVCIFCIGVVVQTTAGTSGAGSSHILGGRFVTGMGVGSLSMSVPMYNAEIAPPEVRGSLVAMQQLAITFGIMVRRQLSPSQTMRSCHTNRCHRINYGTNHIGGTGSAQKDTAWLLPLALQLVPAVVLGIGMIFMPFSPRWLVHHDREEEAKRVLMSLRGLSADDPLLQLEFLEIKAQSLFEKRTEKEKFPHLERTNTWSYIKLEAAGFASLFTTWPMFRRVMVATVTMTFQQWTGVNAVLYYAPSIFEQLGMSSNTTSLLATGVVGIAMFIATIPAVIWVDNLGRKPVLVVGAIGMAACHFIIAGIFAQNENQWDSHRAAGWAAVAMVWLFVVHFGYSWGPCAWIIIAEIWPLSVRAKGTALGASANWMNNFIVGQVTPDMLQDIRYGTYIFFGVITFFGALFIAFLVPETKQLSLEEMDVIFGSEGTAVSDFERQAEISREIGLDEALGRLTSSVPAELREVEVKQA